MIVISMGLIGAVIGGLRARKAGGKPADIAQYAAGHGIALAILGLLITIAIGRVAL